MLFPKEQRHTVAQYITATLTGAITGTMKKSMTYDEFIKICEKARRQQISLTQIEEYVTRYTPSFLCVYDILLNRLETNWRSMLQKKAPINKRTYELKFLV